MGYHGDIARSALLHEKGGVKKKKEKGGVKRVYKYSHILNAYLSLHLLYIDTV